MGVTINKARFNEKIKERIGDKITVISEFNGLDRPINIIYHCNKHGDTMTTLNAKNIFNKDFCPCKRCQSEHKSQSSRVGRVTKGELYKELVDYCLLHNGSVIETEWAKAKSIYHFKCDNPNHPIFTSTADSLISIQDLKAEN